MPSATPRRKRGGAGAGASNGVANGTMSAKRAGKGKGKGKRGASPSAAPAQANGGSRRVNSKPATGSASRDSTKRSRPRGSVSAFGGAPRHLAVHRCRFVDFVPSAIQCVAFDASGTLLAVARESGDVEVWSPECAWAPFMVRRGATCVTSAQRRIMRGTAWQRRWAHMPLACACSRATCAASVCAQGVCCSVPGLGRCCHWEPCAALVCWRPQRRSV